MLHYVLFSGWGPGGPFTQADHDPDPISTNNQTRNLQASTPQEDCWYISPTLEEDGKFNVDAQFSRKKGGLDGKHKDRRKPPPVLSKHIHINTHKKTETDNLII